jgi:anti-sigma factor ChrR (cupin superfamily)
MKQIDYAMQFKGSAAPEDASNPAVLKVEGKAKSAAISSVVGAGGLTQKIEPAQGGEAIFNSTVKMLDDGTFDENGTISFGTGNSLRFRTLDKGHAAPSPEPGVTAGAVIWQVEGGEGQFAGATGLITSNFYFNAAGEVTDNQFGVIFAP